MNRKFKLLFVLGMLVSMSVQAESDISATGWVIVLKDLRPARLQGWQRDKYSGSAHYSSALELKRLGKAVARKHSIDVQVQWFINSLKVYCLFGTFNNPEESTLESLRADKNVKWVQESNDFSLMKTIKPEEIAPGLLNPPELRLPETINGAGAVVAIVDSAVDDSHPDLTANVVENIDYVATHADESSGEPHGTAIAGIIIADQLSDVGATGIASGAKLKAYRGCWESNERGHNCNTLSLARSLDAVATAKVNILNLSLSGPKDELLDQLIENISSNGTYIVTAFDPSRPVDNRFPSPSPSVLVAKSEMMVDHNENIFSAPGMKIVALPGNRADLMHGHSMAAAYTSGVLALCVQIEAQLNKKICGARLFETNKENKIASVHDLISVLEQELK